MNFVQPYIFWGLPLVALPLLIHLLNRLRYRSVKWGAMIFLLSAAKSSIRRARLKHYLILAMRTLAILFLLLALARPIAGGWLGAVAGGAPETVFLTLDRSASMETAATGRATSREQALGMFEEAAGLVRGDVRFILAESAMMSVQEVPGTGSLSDLSLCAGTASTADMPALFDRIYEYAIENRCGDMEIWAASDMQASNWRITSPEWLHLKDRFNALPQTVSIRIISLIPPAAGNLMTSLTASRRLSRPGSDLVNVSFRIERNIPGESIVVPVTLSIGGSGQQEDVRLDGNSAWLLRSLPLADEQKEAGWGMLEIPTDGNVIDNSVFFTYGSTVSGLSALVADRNDAARILSIAAAPDPGGMNQACLPTTPSALDELQWGSLSMLVWQAGKAGRNEALIENFCRRGGTVVVFPSGRKGESVLGLEWGEVETAPGGRFSVVSWESMDGPLARTGDGRDLPVSELEVLKRQPVWQTDKEQISLRTYASYRDGKPFLQGFSLGDGNVFVCTTLPVKEWSDLQRGTVLVPMMQRLLSRGKERLDGSENGSVGMVWKSGGVDWVCVDGGNKDPAGDAGVYRIGGRLVALNVPEAEHDLETVQEADLRKVLEGINLEFVESSVGEGGEKKASEIWPLFAFLMGAALLGEAALLSGDRLT